jgi:hypothetical protein
MPILVVGIAPEELMESQSPQVQIEWRKSKLRHIKMDFINEEERERYILNPLVNEVCQFL